MLASLTAAAAPSAALAQPSAPAPLVAALPSAATVAPSTAPAAVAPVQRKLRLSRHRLDLRVGGVVRVRGRLVSAVRDRAAVRLQLRKPGRWVTIDRGRTRPGGRFTLRDRRHLIGSAAVRVVAPAKRGYRRAVKRLRMNVYRVAHASWYGPGLYGNPLGCGGTLHTGTLGVANKSLPCGTKVTLRHGSRSVRVRVIDRGPYVGGREYDLTAATAQRLGFSGHGPLQVTR